MESASRQPAKSNLQKAYEKLPPIEDALSDALVLAHRRRDVVKTENPRPLKFQRTATTMIDLVDEAEKQREESDNDDSHSEGESLVSESRSDDESFDEEVLPEDEQGAFETRLRKCMDQEAYRNYLDLMQLFSYVEVRAALVQVMVGRKPWPRL
jgi:hypothetical protein